jgi:hypothetical protein
MKRNNNSTRTTVGARLGAGVGATDGAAVGANCVVLNDKRKKPKQQSKNQQYTTEQ